MRRTRGSSKEAALADVTLLGPGQKSMDHCKGFHKGVILLLVLNIGEKLCQEINAPFESLNLKLYNVSSQQRLVVEWTVSDDAYESESDIMFHIQVGRAKEMNIIHNHKFDAHLSMTNEPFHWAWDSELPLECESHSVRIRSAPSRSKEERWSAWSAWKTHYGEDHTNRFVIYPHEKIVREGSNVSFCCIPSKGEQVTKMNYGIRRGLTYDVPNGSAGTFVITVSNVKMSASDGTNVICFYNKNFHGTVLIVSRPPDEPSNISCETSDMKILTCTWSPGSLYNFQQNGNGDGKLNPKYTMYERFTNITTYCQARNSCVWPIERSQAIYNFTLTAENRLGRESVNIVVNVSENVRPYAPKKLFVDNLTSRGARLSWSLESNYEGLELFCQTGLWKSNSGEELISMIIMGTRTSPFTAHLGQERLQPYSNYSLRVRCAVTSSYKWSEWSKNITLRTPEDVPTAPLDVWREVNETNRGKIVTLHWRPLSELFANGNIYCYNVTWKLLGELSETQHWIVSDPHNCTQITVDNQAYVINITAINSVGSSPAAEIRIPASSRNGMEEVQEERARGKNGAILLSWNSHHNIDNGYMVEWCNYPRTPHCDLQWKRLNSSVHQAVIESDAFRPGVRYHFQIYGSTPDGEHLLERRAGYIEELAVSDSPVANIVESEPYQLHLSWAAYTVNDSQEGFIIGYKVYIKPPEDICELKKPDVQTLTDDNQVCSFLLQDPNQKTFTIKRLKPNTEYEVAVAAVTEGGESPLKFVNVRTPSDINAAILAIVLSVVMFSLVALTLLAIGYWKRKRLKNLFYPDIPSPNKSNILSFDAVQGNEVRKMMSSTSSTQFQNISVVKVQEPQIPEDSYHEKYQEQYSGCSHRYENEKMWCRCSEKITSDSHVNRPSPSREDMQEKLYPCETFNYMQFFNRNYSGTPKDVFGTVVHLGYKPQTGIPSLGLPLNSHHSSLNDVKSMNLSILDDLEPSDASKENLYSLEIGEMSPVSTSSSSFMLRD